MVKTKFLCLGLCIVLLTATIFPPEVAAGGYKRYLIAYLVAKALKPRFVPIPLPLPLPIKIKKESHVKVPVHSYSHSAHAELVQDYGHHGGYGGGGYDMGGFGGHMMGY